MTATPDDTPAPARRPLIVVFEPVQEFAAEPDTLAVFADLLRRAYPEPAADRFDSFPGRIGSLTGIPLIADPRCLPGYVYARPHPQPRTDLPCAD